MMADPSTTEIDSYPPPLPPGPRHVQPREHRLLPKRGVFVRLLAVPHPSPREAPAPQPPHTCELTYFGDSVLYVLPIGPIVVTGIGMAYMTYSLYMTYMTYMTHVTPPSPPLHYVQIKYRLCFSSVATAIAVAMAYWLRHQVGAVMSGVCAYMCSIHTFIHSSIL